MAWTTPRTWTDGELVTASIMDTHVKANFDSTWHLITRKTADESVTSSTVVQNDDAFSMVVAASEVWALQYRLRCVAATAGAFRFVWTFPASAEVEFSALHYAAGAEFSAEYDTSSPSTDLLIGLPDVSPEVVTIIIDGFYIGAANSGTLQLQWAQQNSNVTSSTLKANSILMGMKLA